MVPGNRQCDPETLAFPFKLIDTEAIKPASVLNLSDYILRPEEVTLLAKGLKFVPKPLKPTEEDIDLAFKEFSRRIKLTAFFDNPASVDKKEKQNLFLPKSEWLPPEKFIHFNIKEQLSELKNSLTKLNKKQKRTGLNLSKGEQKALKRLQRNKDIVLKPADKGSSVVVLNRANYIKEGYRQLDNPNHYKKIPDPIYPKVTNKLNSALDKILNRGLLTQKQHEYLKVPEQCRDRRFYMLPKIHKERNKWSDDYKTPPCRPIVSDCESDTYHISEYIDHFLYPLATQHPSYIRDTPDFLEKLSQIEIPPNCLLITLDVDSLYTNIDNKAGLESVRQTFQNNPDPKRPDVEILRLLLYSLKNNDFTFNNEWFLQISGTAMGKKFAPNYANIFMASWEKEALDKCSKQPLCYFRYLDDIFIIWQHSEADFNDFFNTLNNHHPTIKLKSTISSESISFLDVTIFKGENFRNNSRLDTKVYFKPTDTHELLHRTSYHPSHTFRGIVKSQILRFKRICSNIEDFHEACSILFATIRTRGYSYSALRKIKRDTLYSMKAGGYSKRCGKGRCKTCKHLKETNSVRDKNDAKIYLKHQLNCQSREIVYLIECSNCGIKYVGETTQKLKDRINQHRSDINRNQDTVVSEHFNQRCIGTKFLQVVPLEKVDRNVPAPYTVMGLLERGDLVRFYQREQYWIRKLNTLFPCGLNKRIEILPPIPFIVKYNDQAQNITKILKTIYGKIQERGGYNFWKRQLVVAFRKNPSLKDILVRAQLKD